MARTRMDSTGTRGADYAEYIAGHEIKAPPSRMGAAIRGLDREPADREYGPVRKCGGFGLAAGAMRSSIRYAARDMALCPATSGVPLAYNVAMRQMLKTTGTHQEPWKLAPTTFRRDQNLAPLAIIAQSSGVGGLTPADYGKLSTAVNTHAKAYRYRHLNQGMFGKALGSRAETDAESELPRAPRQPA